MQVLMQDVAAAAGVSVTTVSHVLNGTRAVAEATRARVLKAVEDLRYVQNTSARALVQGTSRVFGLIISDIENPFFPPLIQGFHQSCQDASLELVLAMTNYSAVEAEAVVRRLMENRARAVAIMSSQFDSALVEQMIERDIPVVMLDSPDLARNKSSMRINYSAGVEQAVKRLRALGHRDVAIVHGPKRLVSAERYRAVMLDKLEAYGMRLTLAVEGNYRAESGAAALEELLASPVRPTAVLCANDLMAFGVMREASRMGLSLPRDLSVIGSDDVAFTNYSRPTLSSVHIPLREIGRAAFEALNAMLDDPERTGIGIPIATEFVARESIGPLRLGAGRQD